MFYIALLAIVLTALQSLCVLIFLCGEGKHEDVKGGPVIRDRDRRGVIRFFENPDNTAENYTGIIR